MAENFLVRYTIDPHSQCIFNYTLDHAPPSVENPNFPGMVIEPKSMMISLMPSAEGPWEASVVAVSGLRIVEGQVKTRKRYDSIPFVNQMDEDGGMPEWLREIVQDHVDTLNHDQTFRPQHLVADTIPEG
jgi:hypothetical protein